MSLNAQTIENYYVGILRQQPTAGEVQSLLSLYTTTTQLTEFLLSQASAEVDPVVRLYQAAFDRVPDSGGLTNWVVNYTVNGGPLTLDAMAANWATQPEFTNDYNGFLTATPPNYRGYVSALYVNVYNRVGDEAGIQNWVNQLEAGVMTPAQVMLDFSQQPEFRILTDAAVNNFLTQCAQYQNGEDVNSPYTGEIWDFETDANTYTLTTSPDTATAVTFLAPKAYNPGGTDLVNTLQNEDVLTGNTSFGATSLTGDLGNPNDSGATVIAPTMTDVETINIAFTNTAAALTLDFQDITGTTTANITRISNNLRDSFVNLQSEVANLGIANTSEAAKATITYLNNELTSEFDEVTLTLNNASMSNTQAEYTADGAALKIEATAARGSDLQNQIETYNIVTAGTSGSTVATLKSGVSDYNDLVVGQRPVTFNITTGDTASLAIGTMRWLGNRVETNSANAFQATGMHQVGTNGLGFVDIAEITAINVAGASDVTLANVGTWNDLEEGSVVSSIDASALTGDLTADISNAAASDTSSFVGGLGNDRFYVGSVSLASVVAEVSGGATGIDTLTVQSDAGATVNLAAGSDGMDVLNLVQGDGASGAGVWSVDYTNGGFVGTTFDNQSAGQAMGITLTDFDASSTEFSIRSTGFNANGDPVTTAMGAVNLTMTQAADVDGGTLSLFMGNEDDRAETNAFSYNNYTAAVSLIDNGTAGANALDSLDLVVNSAGALGTGALALTVVNSDFQTQTTLSSVVDATNTVNIGYQAAAGSSDYSTAGTNGLNSTTYDGSAYLGDQSVTFGDARTYTSTVGKSFDITTGEGDDSVDLSFMTTSAANTTAGYNLSSWLLNTDIVMGAGDDELVLSATLADPRAVVSPDPTYDGYFQNWEGIEALTINNRNSITSSRVNLDAYAQINNENLDLINFVDVSGTLDVGFRFTNDLTVTVDACAATGTGVQTNKMTTIISQSESDLTLNVDQSYGLTAVTGNELTFTSTGASLGNNVTVNFDNISSAGMTLNTNTMTVTAGSLDTVDFDGALGLTAAGVVAAGGTIAVTTVDTWTEAGESTTYDFGGVVNLGSTSNGTVNFSAAAEGSVDTDVIGLTIYGSSAGGSATNGVSNTITGSADNDTIRSAGYQDTIDGGAGVDTITYTGNDNVATNAVTITGGTGADSITVASLIAGETASINGGAGNDTISVGLETDTFNFASANVSGTAIAAGGATVAQTILNVGVDAISSFNFDGDVVNLSKTVFGADLGSGATADNLQVVATTDTLLAASTAAEADFIVVQSAANGDVSVYYSQIATAATDSVASLVLSGNAVLIGTFTSVTGTAAVADFAFVA